MTRTPARFRGLLILALAAAPAFIAVAQDPDPATTAPTARADLPEGKDIVEKAIEKMGGRKAFEKIDSSKIKGSMSTPMGEMQFEMYAARPGKFLMKQIMPGGMGEASTGSDGKIGWMMNPMMGGAQLIEGEQLEGSKSQARIYELVIRLADDAKSIDTVDQVEFQGADCYKLNVVSKEGDEETVFFDANTGLIAGVETTEDSGPVPTVVTIGFSDWKQYGDIKGFSTMSVEQMGMAMEMVFSEVSFNDVDDAVFKLPPEVEELVAETATSQPAE